MLIFLYYTDNVNPAHYNFRAIYMWNNANYTEKCYTNIHAYCTNNCQLHLKPVFSSFYYNYASPVQHPDWRYQPGTVPGKDLRTHPIKMPAVPQLYMFLQNVSVTESSNSTKKFQSHTDDPKTTATN